MPSERLARLLSRASMRVLDLRGTYGGTTGAKQMRVSFAEPGDRRPLIVMAKWKRAPSGLDGANNNPRRELAAYAAQRLMLDAPRFVVPPTVLRCIGVTTLRRLGGDGDANVPGLKCVFGVLSYWLPSATHDGVWDKARFAKDPAYRRNMADLNVFTYLIEHRDSRSANFMRAKVGPRVFAVDNGLSFGSFLKNPMAWFSTDWSKIFVPRVSRATVERLRELTRADLERVLRVVSEHVLAGGRARAVTPTSPRGDGVHVSATRVQLGLTRAEITAMHQRIKRLLERVDGGRLPVF